MLSQKTHPYTGNLNSETGTARTRFYIVKMFWERISRLAYCALEDNAFLLVLESGNIHDNLHHSVLEPQSCPHTAFNHILAYQIGLGAHNLLWYDFFVGAHAQVEGHTGRADVVCIDLVFLAA